MTIPVVPISEFKANPARFMKSGAIVTNHGKPRARLVPITDDAGDQTAIAAAKATLTILYRVQPAEDIAAELDELAAARHADVVGDPR